MTKRTALRLGLGAALAAVLLAGPAAALKMEPDTITVTGRLGGTIEYDLTGSAGDATILFFDVTTTPLVADTIVIAFDRLVVGGSVLSDPDGIIKLNLPAITENQILLDVDGESTAHFSVELLGLAGAPTKAGFFVNPLTNPDEAFVGEVTFRESIPEPSSAVVFAVGMMIVQGAVRRRRS